MDATKKELENTKTTEPLHYGNSTRAQKDFISGRINNSVFLASCLVEELVRRDVLSHEDIENLYKDKSDEIEELEEKIEELEEEKEELESEAEEVQDVLEWWVITDSWVFNRLRDAGEPVIDSDKLGLMLWGRCCSGQSIVLDPTFWDIYQSGAQNIRE